MILPVQNSRLWLSVTVSCILNKEKLRFKKEGDFERKSSKKRKKDGIGEGELREGKID